jgi:hypothetical protein
MAAIDNHRIDNHRAALAGNESDASPYSVRRSLVIIAGLSLGFWSVLGLIVYEIL